MGLPTQPAAFSAPAWRSGSSRSSWPGLKSSPRQGLWRHACGRRAPGRPGPTGASRRRSPIGRPDAPPALAVQVVTDRRHTTTRHTTTGHSPDLRVACARPARHQPEGPPCSTARRPGQSRLTWARWRCRRRSGQSSDCGTGSMGTITAHASCMKCRVKTSAVLHAIRRLKPRLCARGVVANPRDTSVSLRFAPNHTPKRIGFKGAVKNATLH